MSTIHLKKKDSASKRLENGSEIDVLYQEFQTLKSQIYGVKREPKPKGIETHWSSKGNKDKAAEKLRESTIQKCQQEFQENLSLIQTSQHKFKKNLFKRSSQVPDATALDDRLVEIGETPMQSQSYSRKFREHNESPSINLEESARVSIAHDNLCFTQGEQLFRDFLNRMQRPVFPQLSASRRTQVDYSLSLSTIKDMLASIAQDHLKKLNFLFETLTFMSRKLHCLEMIIQEYGKILKTKFQTLQRNQEQQVIINVESLQRKYATQLQKLTQFYQQQLRRQSSKKSIDQPRTSQDNIAESLKMENTRLNQLLDQARCLISTKEQLITALTEENQELREEVEKWKRPNLIRGSAESSLGYSATADKHPKKDGSSHQMELIAERLNLALGPGREDKRGWDDFEEGSHDDINYSELQSVRDKSMDEWDISHLQMRQTSNAKSLEQDCLKIMRDKQGEVSQDDI